MRERKARVIPLDPYLHGWKKARPFHGMTTTEWIDALRAVGITTIEQRRAAEVSAETNYQMLVAVIKAQVMAEVEKAMKPGLFTRLWRALRPLEKPE